MNNTEKEINELAQDIAHICPDMVENYCGDINCVSCLAKKLVSVGYRKAPEVHEIPLRVVTQEDGERLQTILDYDKVRKEIAKDILYEAYKNANDIGDVAIQHWAKERAKAYGVEVEK